MPLNFTVADYNEEIFMCQTSTSMIAYYEADELIYVCFSLLNLVEYIQLTDIYLNSMYPKRLGQSQPSCFDKSAISNAKLLRISVFAESCT